MQNESVDQRYAPPQAHVEDIQAQGDSQMLAGRGARLGAALIDVAIMIVAMAVLSFITPYDPLASKGDPSLRALAINSVLGLGLFVALQGFTVTKRAQTLGKMMLKIRIARPDGTPASFGRIMGLRYGVGMLITLVPMVGQIYSLLDLLFIFRESRRCLHDNIADTVVLKA